MYSTDASSPIVTDCAFLNNTAGDDGGGMVNDNSSIPTLTNCLFSSNSANRGGGVRNNSSSPTLTNCTFNGNTANWTGGALYNWYSTPTVTNCILWGNTGPNRPQIAGGAIVLYSDVQDGTGQGWFGEGCIDSDPMFADSDGRLSLGSPCIDAGDDAAVPSDIITDLDGNPRFAHHGTVDMGAYEVQARLINVPDDYGSIQEAIDASISGGQIEVAPGTYNEAIDFKGKAIWLYSSGGPDVTTIDGDGAYHVVQCMTAEGPGTILEGFTITGGNANGTDLNSGGGGMINNGSPTVKNCTFTDNSAIGSGGGMYNAWGNPTVTNCTFTGNSANEHGGGMANYSGGPTPTSSATVTNCTFSYNWAGERGGGLHNFLSSPTFTGCTFNGNNAVFYGGGMDNYAESNPEITNCTLNGNTAGENGGGMCNDQSSPTLTNCDLSGNSLIGGSGGGMYNYDSSNPTLTNCTFTANEAYVDGGGMLNNQSNPTVTNCTFSYNLATYDGGGMNNELSSPRFTGCTFSYNWAGRGGGIHNYQSSPRFTGCKFNHNNAVFYGGGMDNYDESYPKITNCTLNFNDAGVGGGGMCNDKSYPKLTNCTLLFNEVTGGGGEAMHNYNSNPKVNNCILWGNHPPQIYGDCRVAFSDVQGGWPGTGNIDTDPRFRDADGRLSCNSPCIDAGNNVDVDDEVTDLDLDGNPRIVDGDLNGDPVVDMGAYEYMWPDDADADGIKDSVDTEPGSYSNDFAEGLTTGTILDRADQLLVIDDAWPRPGVIIISFGGGTTFASVNACEGSIVRFFPYSAVIVTYSSIDITVVQGTVEIVFTADDGTQAQTSMSEGNSIEFEPETCAFTAPSDNEDDVVIIVDGGEIILEPGESKLVANVDIDPDTLNLKSQGQDITGYIELPPGFDVGQIDVSTVLLNGQVPAQLHPVEVGDYDGDGIADLMVKFDRAATCAIVEVGDAVQITVAGQLSDGTEFEGCDKIRVIAP
jgi:parallel beta-helix repeat protein